MDHVFLRHNSIILLFISVFFMFYTFHSERNSVSAVKLCLKMRQVLLFHFGELTTMVEDPDM